MVSFECHQSVVVDFPEAKCNTRLLWNGAGRGRHKGLLDPSGDSLDTGQRFYLALSQNVVT